MIFCCGEALIDMIPAQTADGQNSFVPHAGGAVFNTAIALGRLDVPTGFISGISRDLLGDILTDALAQSHVDTSHVVLSDKPTTLAFVKLDNGQAKYSFYDENTAGRMLDPDNLPDLPADVSALYFGGISLISEPCAEFYLALALREAGQKVIMVDPNIRTSFISDAPRYRARLETLIAKTDILKVSDEDLNWILPGSESLNEKAAAIRAKGPEIVIVTRGSEGASAYFADGARVDVAAQKVKVADTVGAGDTFNAGVLANLHAGGSLNKHALSDVSAAQLEAALAYGAKVAGVTVSRHGANPPWASELSN